jgi:hypothetical protein
MGRGAALICDRNHAIAGLGGGIVDEVGSGGPGRLKLGDAVMAVVVPKGSRKHRWHRPEVSISAKQRNFPVGDVGPSSERCGRWGPSPAAPALVRR